MLFLIVAYLIALLTFASYSVAALCLEWLPAAYSPLRVALTCCAVACIGGCLYCVRAVYLNRCVYDRWDPKWHVWYFLRPLASLVCGGASFLFLKAGLLILESNTKSNASEIGFFALAFIAGLNVDKFVAKIEGVAQAVWGIDKSRSATGQKD
ncbi:hypothetical protein ACU4GI_38450 [Cupriavidus basilensis]